MTILAKATYDKHREVENLPLIQKIMTGKVTKPEYVFYLYELYHIYGVLEDLAEKEGLLFGLTDVKRQAKIKQDLDELDPGYERDIFESTSNYIQYLKDLVADPTRKHLLFAHIYVRHMGDLYGGKLMARVIPGSGYSYQFEDRPKLIKEFSERLSMGLADEANKAFDFFVGIFTEMGNHLDANI
jgi:heme oxygenase